MPSGIVRTVADLAGATLEPPGSATAAKRSIGWPTNASAASRRPDHERPRGTSAAKVSSGRTTTRVVSMDNSKLLPRDLLDRVPENVGVLETDVRQQHDPRAQDVRRIVASSQPGFDDRDVDRGVRRTR